MKYKLVIFDMDGTFLDSKEFHARLFYEFFKKYFQPVEYEKCYKAVGTTVRQLFDECGVPESRQSYYFDLLDNYYNHESDALIPMTKISEDFNVLLEWLRKNGVKNTLVTNSLKCVVLKIIDFHGLNRMFDDIEAADRDSTNKIERCKKVIKKYGIPSNEVLLVGDTESDMELAREMNFDACFANTKIAWRTDEDYILNILKPEISIFEYKELIEKLKNQ